MSQMKTYLERFDDRKMAKHGDPVRYRRQVAAFLAHYDEIRAGRDRGAEGAGAMIVEASFVIGSALAHLERNTALREEKSMVRQMFEIMQAELPVFHDVSGQFAAELDRLYNREERTRKNLGVLWGTALFEIERIKAEMGFFDRLGSKEWRFANEMKAFAGRKIEEIREAANPQPEVVRQTVFVDRPVYQAPLSGRF